MRMSRKAIPAALLLLLGTSAAAQQGPDAAASRVLNLDLEQAIEIALSDNPTVQVADMEIQRQEYVRRETVGNLIPSLSATGQYTFAVKKQEIAKGLSLGADNTVNAGASLSVPIFVPAVYATLKLNDAQIANAVEAARASKIEMVNQVKKAYYQILLLDESLAVLQESERLMQQTVDNTRVMYESELSSEYDLLTAEVNLNNLKPTILQTRNGIETYKMMMRMLLSLPQDVDIVLDGLLSDYSDDILAAEAAYSTDISDNTDLRTLDIQAEMLRQQLRIVNAQRIPTIAAFGQATLYGNDMEKLDFGGMMGGGSGSTASKGSNPFYWQYPINVGVSISIPIFNGGRINSQARQAQIAIEQLSRQREYLEESKNVEVQTAINNLLTAREQMTANDKVVQQASKAYEITEVRYNAGASTILELSSAQNTLTQARLNYSQAIYDYLAAEADYEKLIGRGF